MSRVVQNAGRASAPVPQAVDPRKAAIKVVRSIVRNPSATDDEVDDALEALIELAKA